MWTEREMERRGKLLAKRALSIWPSLATDPKAIAKAAEDEMRTKAAGRDVSKVPMTNSARELFDALRAEVRKIDDRIIELAEQKSVSYHGPNFFLEVIPRKRRINLLLPMDFNEIDDPSGIAEDNTQYKFVVNAKYDGGVNIPIRTTADVAAAAPMVRQAFELAGS